MKDNIYFSDPIDSTAKRVTSQSGCSGSHISDEKLRENLVKNWKHLRNSLVQYPKNSRKRKQIGLELLDLQDRIHEIRPKKKAPGVENYFINAARDILTKAQFNIIMSRAVKEMEEK